jgi:hypothetical protein
VSKHLIEIPLDESGAVVVAEVLDDDIGMVPAGAERGTAAIAERLGGSVEASLEKVVIPTAQLMFDRLSVLRPDAVEVEFGLRLVGKGGVVFASSEVEGNLRVKLTWSPSARD